MDYLTKTIWVMCAYGAWHLAWGFALSVPIVIYASRRKRLSVVIALLIAAVLPLWIAAFIAADSGYRAWQSSPNPPDEAFSDTGPILFLLAGWIPSSGIVYLLLRISRFILPPPAPIPAARTPHQS